MTAEVRVPSTTTAPRPAEPLPRRRLTPWMLGVGVVTFLAGLLFGYDQGVISGALPLLQDDLGLSTIESEIITSWVTLGALVGALAAGGLADQFGRRSTAVAAGVLFAAGALLEAVSPGAGLLTFARVVTGVGVGFASVVAPLYAAEMSPKSLRGRFVSSYQLAIRDLGLRLLPRARDAWAVAGGDPGRLAAARLRDRGRSSHSSQAVGGTTAPTRAGERDSLGVSESTVAGTSRPCTTRTKRRSRFATSPASGRSWTRRSRIAAY